MDVRRTEKLTAGSNSGLAWVIYGVIVHMVACERLMDMHLMG